jgi:hypothetical protein
VLGIGIMRLGARDFAYLRIAWQLVGRTRL